jgi:hypothetical protein
LPEPLRTMIELDAFTGFAPWGTHRAAMGGRGFRKSGSSRSEIRRCPGGRRAEDGSLTKGRSVGRTACRLPVRLETAVCVHAAGRLGICIATHERPSALLAEHVAALLRQTGCKAGEGEQERELSHVSPHLWDTAECNRENPKVVQELLRHASLKVTTDVYMQAVSPQKREAQSRLVKMVKAAGMK